MKSKILVYRASSNDIAIINRIINEYYDAIGVILRDSQEKLVQYFNKDSGIWIASYENNVVGCVVLRPLETKENACEVKRLYVKESHRGMGIADDLMEALENYAVSQGYVYIYLDSRKDLKAAIYFYKRREYKICERYNNNPEATIFMYRKIINKLFKN